MAESVNGGFKFSWHNVKAHTHLTRVRAWISDWRLNCRSAFKPRAGQGLSCRLLLAIVYLT